MPELSSRPWSREIPDGPWDYVVIGSGMGGMTVAALLSRLGRRVLVLEQHYVPGGFTQTFRRRLYRWDVGVHLVGEMSTDSSPGRLLASLTDDRLQWAWLGEVYDEFNFPDGFTLQLPAVESEFRDALCQLFPGEHSAIDRYLALIHQAARSSANYLQMRPVPKLLAPGMARLARKRALPHLATTTAEVLGALTNDPRLRSVLAAQWGYYGSTPSRSSFAMHALMVNHFLKGAYYPVGGAASIAYEMLETVAAGGGWTAVRRPVTSIIVHKGSAVGVRLADGTEIPSRRVISASGLSSRANMLPPETLDLDHRFSGAGPAHVSLYLGFEGEISAAGAFKYSQWFFESWDMEIDSWDIEPGVTRNRAPVLFCSFPSLKDPKHDPGAAQRHTGEAITFVPWRSFKRWLGTKWQKRGSEYDWFKEQLTERLLGQYDKHYPDLTPMIRHAELSTPLSTYHFARSYQGSIYGLATEPERFLDDSLVPKTRVRGLFLAGTDVMTPGVAGAMGGGILAAVAAEPIGAIRYLRPLMKGKGSLTSV